MIWVAIIYGDGLLILLDGSSLSFYISDFVMDEYPFAWLGSYEAFLG